MRVRQHADSHTSVHDYFRILLDAINTESDTLDYDRRSASRNKALETSVATALDAFEALIRRCEALRDRHTDWFSRRATLAATTPDRNEFGTTFGRELWFCTLHSIHHYALAKAILRGEANIDIRGEFGVAPSTVTNLGLPGS